MLRLNITLTSISVDYAIPCMFLFYSKIGSDERISCPVQQPCWQTVMSSNGKPFPLSFGPKSKIWGGLLLEKPQNCTFFLFAKFVASNHCKERIRFILDASIDNRFVTVFLNSIVQVAERLNDFVRHLRGEILAQFERPEPRFVLRGGTSSARSRRRGPWPPPPPVPTPCMFMCPPLYMGSAVSRVSVS